MEMRRIISLIPVLLLLVACRSIRPTATDSTRNTDTTMVVIVDSVVSRIDTVYYQLPTEQSTAVLPATPHPSHLETAVAKSDAWIDSLGMLHHTLYNNIERPLPVPVVSTDRHHTENTQQLNTSAHIETITEYKEIPLHRWQKALMYVGALCLFSLLLMLAFCLCKILRG